MKYLQLFLLILTLLVCFLFIHTSSTQAQDGLQEDKGKSPYLIVPNDVLNIFVWNEPELTQDIIVMPDGRITFPMIGEVVAQGQTVMALRNAVTEKLKDYVSNPDVTVIVRESRSRRIYLIGQVNRPGPYALEPDMTALQALSTAGGFSQWADTKNVLIVRREGEKEVLFLFDYKDFITGKNLEKNIILKPNDTIVVP
jgi:polysaccharide export outer membrane protein